MESITKFMAPIGRLFYALKEEVVKALKAQSGRAVWVENQGEKGDRTCFMGSLEGDEIHFPTVDGIVPKDIVFAITVPKNTTVGIKPDDSYAWPREKDGKNRLFIKEGMVVRVISDGDAEVCADEILGTVIKDGKTMLRIKERVFGVTIGRKIPREKEAINRFLEEVGCPSEIRAAVIALKFSEKALNMNEHHDGQPNNGVDISGKSKDGLPGRKVAESEPGDELSEKEKQERAAVELAKQGKGDRNGNTTNTKSGGKSNGKPKPEGKVKSNRELTSDAKAGVADVVA